MSDAFPYERGAGTASTASPATSVAEGTEPVAVTAAPPRTALMTRPFVAICAIMLLGFSSNYVIQPILPILVLQRGGDATLVGLIIAAFSFPSVVLRPFMGRLVDEWSQRRVLGVGTGLMSLSGFAYLVPNLGAIFVNRIVHGTAWAAFNTAANSTLARLAPAGRRGEASGIFNLMPGIAQMVMPAVGLLLLGAFDTEGPFLASGLLGLAVFAVVAFGPLPKAQPAPPPPSGAISGLLERGAVLPMTLEFLFTSTSALFLVYPPVFAASHNIPVSDLTLYYPVYGIALVGVRFAAGRFLDRAPRGVVIAAGAIVAIAALGLAVFADSTPSLTVAGALYASAAAFTSPTTMALAIDRADPRRMGAAMATYSLGFQLALGAGAAAWGFLIDAFGYPAPYIGAIGLQVGVLILLGLAWQTVRSRPVGADGPRSGRAGG
jgi:predicted MFS family arabinose efflux permease